MKRPRTSVPRRRDPETGQVQAIPPGLDPRVVLDRYLTEATTSQIAKEYGVARKSLVAWLREVAPEQWTKVQVLRALIRKEDSDDGIEAAGDALSLARAREMLRSSQWDLERLDRDTYGQGPQVVINNGITADQALEAVAGSLLDKLLHVDKPVITVSNTGVMSNSTPKLINDLEEQSTGAQELSAPVPQVD